MIPSWEGIFSSVRHPRPRSLDKIPTFLRGLPQFVLWQYEHRGDATKPTKVPYQPDGRRASSTDSSTWSPLPTCVDAAERRDWGLGFVTCRKDGLVGVDLDKCIAENGAVEPWAQDIIDRLDSYTEVSPSGRGFRMWVRGTLPPEGRKKGRFEVYDSGRFLTVTGHHVPGTPATIEERTEALAAVHAEVFGDRGGNAQRAPYERTGDPPGDATLQLIREDSELRQLYEEPHSASRHPSESEVDQALATHLAIRGVAGAEIEAVLRERRAALGGKRKDIQYFQRTVERALGWAQSRPRRPYHDFSDIDNGLRLAEHRADVLAHSHQIGDDAWAIRRDGLWRFEGEPGARIIGQDYLLGWERDALSDLRAARAAAKAEPSESADKRVEMAEKYLTKVRGLKSGARLSAMLKEAKPRVQVPAREWDAEPHVLSVPGGIVELAPDSEALERDGHVAKLREARPSDLVTMRTAARFDPDATCDVWRSIVEHAVPDPATRRAVQQLFGMALVAGEYQRQKKFLLVWGPPNTLKTTMIDHGLCAALGSYAETTRMHTFSDRAEMGANTPGLASIARHRVVQIPEIGERVKFGGETLKAFSGGDRLEATQKFERPGRYDPIGALMFRGNVRPRVSFDDEGLWNRLIIVAFTNQITVPDGKVRDKINLDAVLKWCIEGYRDYLRNGLQLSDEILKERDAYRDSQNPLSDYIAERCVLDSDAETTLAAVYEDLMEYDPRLADRTRRSTLALQLYAYPGVSKGPRPMRRGRREQVVRGLRLAAQTSQTIRRDDNAVC